MSTETRTVPAKFFRIQNQWVILDRDIAALFGVETKRLLERCKRNEDKLSAADYFQLSNNEFEALRSQIATIEGRGKLSQPLILPEQIGLLKVKKKPFKKSVWAVLELKKKWVKQRVLELLELNKKPVKQKVLEVIKLNLKE